MNRHGSWTVILDCSCFIIDFFLKYQYGTGSGGEYKIMLSTEKGGSSSKNWTRPMGKPKMRKEGLNIWWISEKSPRVFPLIAGRMFSFMKTRLSLSDTDNLSIRIFILCTGCVDVKGIFLPINFRRVAFLQNPGHSKRVMLPSAPANLICI